MMEENLASEQEKEFCRVAVNMPGPGSVFLYQIPDEKNIRPGMLVEMPLGKRKGFGVVVECKIAQESFSEQEKKYQIKKISHVLEEEFSLDKNELEFYQWISRYYHYSLGLLISDIIPNMMKRPRPLVLGQGKGQKIDETPSELQRPIYEAILNQINATNENAGFWRHYIHGVTGSGKSLIYLHLLQQVIKNGKSVLFMLPEINLTPQFVEYFENYLSCPVIAYHSAISSGEKYQIWKFLKNHSGPVMVLGVRSSLFLPSINTGLIIVDEEHDASFKQTDRCPYNGRDLAIKKAQILNIPIVLGSATPTVENYHHFKLAPQPRTNYYAMEQRVRGVFPEVKLLNAREECRDEEDWPLLSESIEAIRDSLDKKEQILVFVNRLGFANFIQCPGCGHTFKDPNTDTNLRYFKNKQILKSAYSDYQIPMPQICPECGNMKLLQQGFGTERLQMVLQRLFPLARVERFDRDEIKNTDQLEVKLQDFHEHKTDIFVGTQMLSKGHNFKRVNKVFILGVDSQLNFPDFRSLERTYQLITQVLGRAGRFSDKACVFIQTLAPENNLFSHIINHHFDSFYQEELQIRQMAQFPPYSKVAMIYMTARKREVAAGKAQELCALMHQNMEQGKQNKKSLLVEILGPAPAMLEKRTGQFTWNIMLKATLVSDLHRVLDLVARWENDQSNLSVKIDVDPYHCY